MTSTPITDPRQAVAWLHRRVGFGLTGAEIDAAAAAGVPATLDRLLDPDRHGAPARANPWASTYLSMPRSMSESNLRAMWNQSMAALDAWVLHLSATQRPVEDWMAWFWHGYFVSGLEKVIVPKWLVNQLQIMRTTGLGSFRALVRAMVTDVAMLVYLDGCYSTKVKPNENFARELMELFTVGQGNHTEADVQAAARALTGYRVVLGSATARYTASNHDNTLVTVLGRSGINTVEGVVDAVTQHPACARHVASRLVPAILGEDVEPALIDELAGVFQASGLDIRTLVRATLEAGLAGRGGAVHLAPVPWLCAAQRATGGRPQAYIRLLGMRDAGQLPMYPPDVSGWPGGDGWLSSSTVIGRTNLAQAVAAVTPAGNPALVAAGARDTDALAHALGRIEGFSPATAAALASAGDARTTLAAALACPDLAVV